MSEPLSDHPIRRALTARVQRHGAASALLLAIAALAACDESHLPTRAPEARPSADMSGSDASEYVISALPPLAGNGGSVATGINNTGVAVGWAEGPHAVRWADEGVELLGELAGDYNSQAFDVNDDGVVVGRSYGGGGERAFRWTAQGGMQNLGQIGRSVSPTTEAWAINRWGVITGTSNGHAFRWTSGLGMEDLGPGDGRDINTSGQVAGSRFVNWTAEHAFLWEADGTAKDLGTLGGCCSRAQAISDGGVVVGESTNQYGAWRAFRWTAQSGMTDLGVYGATSVANDASALGRIVGRGELRGGVAAAFTVRGTTVGLLPQLPGVNGAGALAVNTCGTIAGWANDAANTPHAVIWAKPSCDMVPITLTP